MKRFKKIILWSVFAILLQASVLLYLDQIMFKNSSNFSIKEVEGNTETTDYEAQIPENAENIQSSYNGQYISYLVDDKFYLLDYKSKKPTEIITDSEDRSILNAKWLPDRNRIVIVEKIKNSNNKNVVNLINYDAKTGEEKQIKEICNYQNGMKVDDIATTTNSGVSYVGISNSEKGNATIYRIDINEDMKKVSTNVTSVGAMEICPLKDTLIYENNTKQKFYSYSNNKNTKLNFDATKKYEILALDSNDKVYMGDLTENKVTKIIYGTIETSPSKWESKKLENPAEYTGIHVNDKNEVLVNNSEKSQITNLTTGNSVSYKGTLVQITDRIICSKSSNKVYIKKL